MSNFVSDDSAHPVLVGSGSDARLVQDGLPVDDQAPVLHGAKVEVRHSHVV